MRTYRNFAQDTSTDKLIDKIKKTSLNTFCITLARLNLDQREIEDVKLILAAIPTHVNALILDENNLGCIEDVLFLIEILEAIPEHIISISLDTNDLHLLEDDEFTAVVSSIPIHILHLSLQDNQLFKKHKLLPEIAKHLHSINLSKNSLLDDQISDSETIVFPQQGRLCLDGLVLLPIHIADIRNLLQNLPPNLPSIDLSSFSSRDYRKQTEIFKVIPQSVEEVTLPFRCLKDLTLENAESMLQALPRSINAIKWVGRIGNDIDIDKLATILPLLPPWIKSLSMPSVLSKLDDRSLRIFSMITQQIQHINWSKNCLDYSSTAELKAFLRTIRVKSLDLSENNLDRKRRDLGTIFACLSNTVTMINLSGNNLYLEEIIPALPFHVRIIMIDGFTPISVEGYFADVIRGIDNPVDLDSLPLTTEQFRKNREDTLNSASRLLAQRLVGRVNQVMAKHNTMARLFYEIPSFAEINLPYCIDEHLYLNLLPALEALNTSESFLTCGLLSDGRLSNYVAASARRDTKTYFEERVKTAASYYYRAYKLFSLPESLDRLLHIILWEMRTLAMSLRVLNHMKDFEITPPPHIFPMADKFPIKKDLAEDVAIMDGAIRSEANSCKVILKKLVFFKAQPALPQSKCGVQASLDSL